MNARLSPLPHKTLRSQVFAETPIQEMDSGKCRDKCTFYASVAQSVEQGTENPRVIGSIPIGGTTSKCQPLVGQSCEQDCPTSTEISPLPHKILHSQAFAGAPLGTEMCRICGRSSSGRAPPCQGGGGEFEPRRPLQHEAIVCAEMHDDGFFQQKLHQMLTTRCSRPYTETIVQQTEAG